MLLTADRCDAMLHDSGHLFRHMWGDIPWTTEYSRECWRASRDLSLSPRGLRVFLNAVRSGVFCNTTNWLEGNQPRQLPIVPTVIAHLQDLGRRDFMPPPSTRDAPALLGFDLSVHTHCTAALHLPENISVPFEDFEHAAACVAANRNILWLKTDNMTSPGSAARDGGDGTGNGRLASRRGSGIAYNLCRNLEWLGCAARGWLPNQHSATIIFTRPVRLLNTVGERPLHACRNVRRRTPRCPAGNRSYSSQDVYFLEVCLLYKLCANGGEIFGSSGAQQGAPQSSAAPSAPRNVFACDYSPRGMDELLGLLGAVEDARSAPSQSL